MKKKTIFLSIIVIAAFILSACQAEVAEEPEAEAGVVTVGYGAPELSGAQGQIMNGLVSNAETKNWAVVTTNANFSAEEQANQMDYFLSLGVDAIVTVPVDSQAICASVAKAKEAGVPFFTIDRAPIGCEIDMVVQSDNYLAGKQAAEEMVKLLTEKYGEPRGVVLELQGDLGQNVAQLRGGGFNDVMAEYPDIEVIQKPTEWQAEKFSAAVLDVLSARDDVDGIYMHSDCVGTTVVLAALEQLGKKVARGEEGHIFIAGVDGCPEALQSIRDGFSDQASSQPIPDFGIIVRWIEMLLNGEEITEGEIVQEGALWSPAIIVKSDVGFMANLATTNVTPENADEAALWGNN
jgi:ABC-type sugar transport system substrate-binding protein